VSDTPDPIADLLAVTLSGRADQLVDVSLASEPASVRGEHRWLREALAAVAVGLPRLRPSAELANRIARSLEKRSVPTRRAVLVIDMQNDHLEPGGPLEVPRARAIVPALLARLEAARKAKEPVVYVVDEHEPGDADLDSWGAHNIQGTRGAEVWAALTPKPGDLIVPKPTYSAFQRSKLGEVLDSLHVDTLELTGCLTEIGIFATATDALQRGFAVEIPTATQAGAAELHEQVTLGVLRVMPPYGPAREARLAAMQAA
jgi:nicotinamidase-related amidase